MTVTVLDPEPTKVDPLGVKVIATLPPSAIDKLVLAPKGLSTPKLPWPNGVAMAGCCNMTLPTSASNTSVNRILNFFIIHNYYILIAVKPVHKALKLRHKKHTGKLLPHKHTSYRVLFLLMIAPIAMLALVSHLNAQASDLLVTATVPAPMPSGAPVITTPEDNTTVQSGQMTVSGTCPVIIPAVIITINDSDTLIGSGMCTPDGTFSVPVSLDYGTHTLVAVVTTITGQTGASSNQVSVFYERPVTAQKQLAGVGGNPIASTTQTFTQPVRINQSGVFVLIEPDGSAVWQGSFSGGTTPYSVQVDWGDGTSSSYTINDQRQHNLTHRYKKVSIYGITVEAKDAAGGSTTLHSVAATLLQQHATTLDANIETPLGPTMAFLQQYAFQLYILTFSGLVFLWYLEHGRHWLQYLFGSIIGRHTRRRKHS